MADATSMLVTDKLITQLVKSEDKNRLVQIDGVGNYTTEKVLIPVPPMPVIEEETPDVLKVGSLAALVEYITSGIDADEQKALIIHVESPTHVSVCSKIFGAAKQRITYISASWSSLFTTSFRFDTYMTQEQIIIGLRTLFEQDEQVDAVVKVLANITDVATVNQVDDGLSQTVVAKTGPARTDNVEIQNPYLLKPFRTFRDQNIQQPASPFIARVKSIEQMGLFEADAQMWKLDAITQIKKYLEAQINDTRKEGIARIPILG